MLEQPEFAWPGTAADLLDLVAAHPWATLVSAGADGLVVSHLPVLPDPGPDGEGVAVVGHLAAVDAAEHALGERDVVLVVQGPHGYVSAGWYEGGPYVPTWNYVVVHLHGRPILTTAEETWDVLVRTVEHFEAERPRPFDLSAVDGYARRLAPAVTGFRLLPDRLVAKAKLSQDKPLADVAAVLRGLEDPTDVHADARLAAAMRSGGPVYSGGRT